MIYKEKLQEGLLDVCQFLELEMKKFLENEGRFKFRVERFWKTICEQNSEMNKFVSEEDIDEYGRVLFLLRKSIYSEYRYLRSKRMSQADCVITIIHRLLEYSEELGEFKFSKEQRIIKKVIDSLWENIKHRAKNLGLKTLSKKLAQIIEEDIHGKLSYHEFSLSEIENPGLREQKLKGETKFYQSHSKTVEIML